MFINLFKSAVTDEAERIEVKSHTRIKDIPELKGLDFLHVLIFVNGFQKNENYILREKDVCTIRCFPSNMSPEKIVANILTGGALMITEEIAKVTANVTLQIADATIQVTEKLTKLTQDMISNALGGIKKYDYENYIDQRSYDYSTKITQNIISADNVVKSPNMRGCMNQLETGSTYPLVIGKSYFVPRMCAKPYITPSGELGYYQTYHALYDLGYNTVNVTDICLGLKKLATNSAKQRNGAITIDGDYDPAKFDIHLEVQESQEVSLYDQMVVQQDINAELMFPKPAQGEQPRNFIYDGISTPYPQKVELEFYLEGLVGKVAEGDNKGKDCDGTVKIKCEYSTDGGVTFLPFGQVGSGSGISYNSSTGETTITMKNYHSMRFVATKVFSASEVFNATNHVVELRIQRTNVHDEDLYIYDTVSLASVRTYTYDPKLSTSSNLVKQSPVCEKDRQRITRLGVTITSNERLYNLGELNCIVQALGRTCTESNGYYTWSNELSETCNPASMALRVLQCGMLGEYIYNDSEIDMQKFGELYKFCDEYDIRDVQGNHVGICANGVVTKQTKLSELLSKILAVGRASRIIRVGKLSLYIDKPIEYTSLILNNQNVLSASNSKNFDELPSGIRAEFVNEDNFNQEDVMFIDYSDAPPRESIQYKTVGKKYEFQTNVEQIKKNALYDLAVLKLRPESWNRKVTSEGCLAFIGAKIEVQDDTIAVGIGDGAEIKDIILDANEEYITGIKTDGEFDVTDTTKEYGVRIQVATIEYGLKYITRKVVVEQEGVYRNFTFDSPISLDELILPASGDILSFGILGKISYESICIGKKADSDGTFELTLVPYVPEIYTADGGQLPEFESNTTAPNYYTPPEQKPNLTQEDLQKVKNDVIDIENGTADISNPDKPVDFVAVAKRDGINLSWTPASNDGLKNCIKKYTLEISKNEGEDWDPVVEIGATEYTYLFNRRTEGYPESSAFEDWMFRIKAENVYGKESEYEPAVVDVTSYGTWTPATPSFVSKIPNETAINISWNNFEGINNKELYGSNKFELKVYYNGTLRKTVVTNETSYIYIFDRDVDGYPEQASDENHTGLDLYTFDLKVFNESPHYASLVNQHLSSAEIADYGTWIIPEIVVNREVVDRTVILTAVYGGSPRTLYGTQRTLVKIKRVGNLDTVDGRTFNQILGITADNNFYTPEFDKSVQTSELADNEPNYRKNTTESFSQISNKVTHTLPLIGQTYRIFKEGNVFTGTFSKDVSDYVSVPAEPTEGMIIHYIGSNITEGGQIVFANNGYYLYESSEWVQVYSKALIVPTTYIYSIQMTNESGALSNLLDDVEVTALCTNISDIVHSHEHYKDLFVERLSAISANLGLISQGGMGSFEDMMNCWALSDLSPEDSGVADGILKGTFRVGDANEYFRVTPYLDASSPSGRKYKIELKAGNIELSTDVGGDTAMDFSNGTYVYNADRTARLRLAPEGITVQKIAYSVIVPIGNENPKYLGWYELVNNVYVLSNDTAVDSQKTYYSKDFEDVSKIVADSRGNMIVSNSTKIPDFGYNAKGTIYHFENQISPTDEEVAEGVTPTNPQTIQVNGTLEDNTDSIVIKDSSAKYVKGYVIKDISQFSNNVVFLSKAEEIRIDSNTLKVDGTLKSNIPTALVGYNEAMNETSTQDLNKTVGEYLGLNSNQVAQGIFN